MDYSTLKMLHVGAVVTSYSLFVLRGVWMIRDSALLQAGWVKVLPHVVDTVLLASAVALAFFIRQYPFVADWLTAKVIALMIYIALGTVALKRARSKRTRIAAWIAAQAVFLYIVTVAVTRNPAGFL
ncbi:MAG: SirB2 family protein [Burkholderiales bacterium]